MANLDWLQGSVAQPSIEQDETYIWQERLRQLVIKTAIATFILMAIGSATRVMNAGLACPDWPLCYGVLVPTQQMNLQVFLEWFHRLDASLVGIMTIALCSLSWWHRKHLPSWLPWSATISLGMIVFQGLLGGLTVTQLLRFDIVTAHLGTALMFFVTLLVIATLLTPYQSIGTVGKLPWIALAAALLVYSQSILGALVGSKWALHQCFADHQLCFVMNSHIIGVVPPTLFTLWLIWISLRTPALQPLLKKLAKLAGFFLVAQIGLGVATFYLHLQVDPLTVAHQAVGAALLGTLVMFAVYAWRDRHFQPS